MTDVCIVGGGAAGLSLAVMLKAENRDLKVTLLEAADRVGRKLATTGNGRCNISNINISAERYHGDREFAEKVLGSFGESEQRAFFRSIGIDFVELEEGKLYPRSLQATAVVDALRFRCDELGVQTMFNFKVNTVKRLDNGFEVTCDNGSVKSRVVVVATGGKAGGKLGTEDGYAILKSLGHKIEKVFPSVVQLKTDVRVVRQLKGIKVMANVTATSDSGRRCEYGEVLFSDYGLSGPPILQVSRLAEGGNAFVSLDIIPDMTEAEIKQEISRRVELFKDRPISELLTGFVHKRLGQVLLKEAGADVNAKASTLNEKTAEKVANLMKAWSFKIIGTTGFENAQVTAGGSSTAQFFDNLMSKKAKGLFAVGEVLNVDGDCGGFNLAFAWSSAFTAANGIKEYLQNDNRS